MSKILNVDEVIETYKSCGSVRSTAKIYKCRTSKIMNILKTNNIERYHNAGRKIRKYFFNEQFFDTLTKNSAYWLGFISADGSIEKYTLTISLQYGDNLHLEKLKKSINGKQPITKVLCKNSERNSKWKDSENCSIRICSKYLIKQLETHDIYRNKSLIFTFPEQLLNSPYLKEFCRGYFDGDGGVSFNKKSKQMQVNVRGTKETLAVFLKIFHKYCDANLDKKISFDSGIFRIQYSGNNICTRILTWLYKGSDLYLDRKYELAKSYFRLNE